MVKGWHGTGVDMQTWRNIGKGRCVCLETGRTGGEKVAGNVRRGVVVTEGNMNILIRRRYMERSG